MGSFRALLNKYRFELILLAGGGIVAAAFGIAQYLFLSSSALPIYVRWLGVPLDDVYIHCRYASNLLHGYSFSFNPGETLTADTSPLWVVLITIGGLFTTRLEIAAILVSLLCYLALASGVYRVARDLLLFRESQARLAGWLTVLASRLAWSGMSGMETALAALIMLLVVEEHVRSRSRGILRGREGILLGLGILTRPEFLFVIVILTVDWIYLRRTADISRWSLAILLFLIIASPSILLSSATSGDLVSHSSVVQGASISILPNFKYLWFALKIIASNNLVIFLLILLSFLTLWKLPTYRLLLIIGLGLPLLQAFVAPQFRHHGRYFFPVLPLVILLGMAVWRECEYRKISPIILRLVPALAILAGLIETGRWAYIEAASVRNINDQHLAAAQWLKTNKYATDILAVHDLGAIGYLTNEHIIDLTGLATPSLWPVQHDQDMVWRKARAMGANMFVIYRRLNSTFYDLHKDSLVLQRDFPVRLPLTSSADTILSIYSLKGSHGS